MIKSDYRFSYGDVQQILETGEGECKEEIFVLNKEYNLSVTEIASRLSITEQVVRNQLSAALKVLRNELSNYSYLFILFTIYF